MTDTLSNPPSQEDQLSEQSRQRQERAQNLLELRELQDRVVARVEARIANTGIDGHLSSTETMGPYELGAESGQGHIYRRRRVRGNLSPLGPIYPAGIIDNNPDHQDKKSLTKPFGFVEFVLVVDSIEPDNRVPTPWPKPQKMFARERKGKIVGRLPNPRRPFTANVLSTPAPEGEPITNERTVRQVGIRMFAGDRDSSDRDEMVLMGTYNVDLFDTDANHADEELALAEAPSRTRDCLQRIANIADLNELAVRSNAHIPVPVPAPGGAERAHNLGPPRR